MGNYHARCGAGEKPEVVTPEVYLSLLALPDDFCSLLSTMRSREISSVIIIQNLAQIKALFKDTWETITGNCDTTVYLGGNEQSTHEYISKLLGKMTIDKKSSGETKGRQGSSSKNIDVLGREILTPDEVRMMDNKKCLVFIRGLNPVMDNKYFTPKHPRFIQSADGEGEPFHFVQRLPDNLLAPPYVILTPEGLMQYEKRKLKGEAVYIDSMTYDEFMMLNDVGVTKRFLEMDRKEAENEYRENEQTGELAYTPDEETEKNLVAELIALKKKTDAKVGQTGDVRQEDNVGISKNTRKSDVAGNSDNDMTDDGGSNDEGSGSCNGTDDNAGDTLSHRLEHLKFTPAQVAEIKRALDEKIPKDYILSYALPENSVVKMAAMRKKYAMPKQNNK